MMFNLDKTWALFECTEFFKDNLIWMKSESELSNLILQEDERDFLY